ncbi:MAG TPA: chemotaxis protein CheW [Anaerolineae bacterium]|nr:chemotaxis protein CheW [Anaerolineae bacterium]
MDKNNGSAKPPHRRNGHHSKASRFETRPQIAKLLPDDDGEYVDQAELAQIWARRAQILARKPPAETVGETLELMVFWLGGEKYGVEVLGVREIHPLGRLTPVPRTPDFVAGVFSARGRILSVIDLRAFFGLSTSEEEKLSYQKIIVVTTEGCSDAPALEVGLLVNEVEDVTTIFKSELAPPLPTHNGALARYTRGITADLMMVLDLAALLSDPQIIIQEEVV